MEMVKRVSDAIEWQMAQDDNAPEDLARAALEAMREPTEAQLAAFHNSCDSNGQCLVKYGYTIMIDAALSGKE